MNAQLQLSIGQHSDAGRKAVNQDCHGCLVPREPQLSLKGAAFAIADGISASNVSQIASETAVKSFLDDYFCTSDAWSVQHAARQVLRATNSWLHSQGRSATAGHDAEKGYVCTFSGLVLKAGAAHLLHIGDSRIYRLRSGALEQLTHDHRQWLAEQSCLSRALGAAPQMEMDYLHLPLQVNDLFLLATDGVYAPLSDAAMVEIIVQHGTDLQAACHALVEAALAAGSDDNLTVQLVRIQALPEPGVDLQLQVDTLPLPPLLRAGDELDGYRILREIHASSRSHVYLARNPDSGEQVVLKAPSIDLGGDPVYLERLLMEEWIARRVRSPHVVRATHGLRPRTRLYTALEHIDGQTLRQWLTDNPRPGLEKVRDIVEQVARGLMALHRAEILHQDLRPENILIDAGGTVTLIDLGAARVAGVAEALPDADGGQILGTALYTAPEYFLGEGGTPRSDLYSLAMLTYYMLSGGGFPYGTKVASSRTPAAQRRLNYRSMLDEETEIPAWVDATLRRALHPDPFRRQAELSEFTHELRQPNPKYLSRERAPLLERRPVRFWQALSALLAAWVVYLLFQGAGPL